MTRRFSPETCMENDGLRVWIMFLMAGATCLRILAFFGAASVILMYDGA